MIGTRPALDAMLHAHGLKVTRPVLAVVEALTDAGHLTTAAVTERARRQLGQLSAQTVYNVLDRLTAAGLVRRIEPAGSPARYEQRTGDNHHHLICRTCGQVTDIDCAAGTRPCLTPAERHGFTIDEAEVTYWGRCHTCAPPAPAL